MESEQFYRYITSHICKGAGELFSGPASAKKGGQKKRNAVMVDISVVVKIFTFSHTNALYKISR